MRRVEFAILSFLLPVLACREELSLGDVPPDPPDPPLGPTCPLARGRETVAVIEESHGVVRDIVADGPNVYALTALPGGGGGGGGGGAKLLHVFVPMDLEGGSAPAFEIHRIDGCSPKELAVDASYAYFTCPTENQVWRVARDRTSTYPIDGQEGASSIVADGRGRAYWAVSDTSGLLRFSDFALGAPSPGQFPIGVPLRSSSLVYDDEYERERIYVSGDHAVYAIEPPAPTAAPQRLADHCDGHALALSARSLFCPEDSSIVRIPLDGSPIRTVATAPGPVTEMVVGRGRVFFQVQPNERRPMIMTAPLDGLGGATILPVPDTGTNLAIDRCFLYYMVGNTLERWGL